MDTTDTLILDIGFAIGNSWRERRRSGSAWIWGLRGKARRRQLLARGASWARQVPAEHARRCNSPALDGLRPSGPSGPSGHIGAIWGLRSAEFGQLLLARRELCKQMPTRAFFVRNEELEQQLQVPWCPSHANLLPLSFAEVLRREKSRNVQAVLKAGAWRTGAMAGLRPS